MAASVLGKRQRRGTNTEATSLPPPCRKRRTTDLPPVIHNDNEDSSNSKTHQNVVQHMDVDGPQHEIQPFTRSLSTRRISSNHTAQDRSGPTPFNNKSTTAQPSLYASNDENTRPIDFKTPTATRFHDALSNVTPTTPKHRVRLTGKPLTPRTPRTLSPSSVEAQTIYAAPRQLFTQSSSPGRLIGRDVEKHEVTNLILEALKSKSGGCIYVSGPPGTGKSAVIDEVSQNFGSESSLKIVKVNCVNVQNSRDLYAKLTQELTLTSDPAKKIEQSALETLFISKKRSASLSYLLVLDEVDSLLDTDCEVLYSFFEWSLHRSSRLILISIANALDLIDRFLPRLKARNLKPRLLPFLPYTASQIVSIISKRLQSTLPTKETGLPDFVPFMHPAAIELCSKKVASQTGDLRKAFDLARRAIDQVEREMIAKELSLVNLSPTKQPLTEISNRPTSLPPTPPHSSPLKPLALHTSKVQTLLASFTAETAPRVGVAHVARLASSIFNNGTTSRLATLNLQQKAVLCSLLAIENKKIKRDPFVTPSKSTNKVASVKDLFTCYKNLCNLDDGVLHPLTNTEFRDVVASLETLGLVIESPGRGTNFLTPTRKLSKFRRNVNSEDRQILSAVSHKELAESLTGPGADLLMNLISEWTA